MTELRNRALRLRRRPDGALADGDLELVEEDVPELRDGQALIRSEYLSVDPTNRIWISGVRFYMDPVPIDAVVRGLGIGEVVDSRREDMPVGAKVFGLLGWQELAIADDSLHEPPLPPLEVLPDPLPAPITAYLGPLGHTGVTAYQGIDLAAVGPDDTVVVSAACGAVGSVAGQIAKKRGAYVAGVAGGERKCRHAVDRLGFDACVDHRADDWREQLAAATPDGIDVDFENVGGPIMDEVLMRINVGARIALCGMIAEYNGYDSDGAHNPGQQSIAQLIMQRATMTGFLLPDFGPRFGEAIEFLQGMIGAGELVYDETIIDGGIDAVPEAFASLFSGANLGKLLVRLDRRGD